MPVRKRKADRLKCDVEQKKKQIMRFKQNAMSIRIEELPSFGLAPLPEGVSEHNRMEIEKIINRQLFNWRAGSDPKISHSHGNKLQKSRTELVRTAVARSMNNFLLCFPGGMYRQMKLRDNKKRILAKIDQICAERGFNGAKWFKEFTDLEEIESSEKYLEVWPIYAEMLKYVKDPGELWR